jgi:hypothetical protein
MKARRKLINIFDFPQLSHKISRILGQLAQNTKKLNNFLDLEGKPRLCSRHEHMCFFYEHCLIGRIFQNENSEFRK